MSQFDALQIEVLDSSGGFAFAQAQSASGSVTAIQGMILAIGGPAALAGKANAVGVASVAALRTLSPLADGYLAQLSGYYAEGDLGGGRFIYSAGSTATDDGGLVIAAAGGVGRWLRVDSGPLDLRWFGAQDNTQSAADQMPTVAAWFAAVARTGRKGYVPSGRYICLSQLTLDLSLVESNGLTIDGDGTQRAILDFTGCTTTPNAQIICTTAPENDFYVKMEGFGFVGNIIGKVLQIGQESFSDPLNEAVLDLYVSNSNASASAVAVELNFIANSELRFVANSGGMGIACDIRRAQFSNVYGSYGNCSTSIYLTGSYTFGNVFHAVDLEVCANCVVCDTSTDISNTFIGGQFNYSDNAFNVLAGSLMVINPNAAPQAPKTEMDFLTGAGIAAGGVEVIGPNIALVSTPTMPASGTAVTNTYGQTASVEVWGGSVTAYVIMPAGGTKSVGAGQVFSIVIRPGESIALTYTAVPNWQWRKA